MSTITKTAIKLFSNPEFGEIRTLKVNDEPLFLLADVCQVLDLFQGDVKRRLEDGVVSTQPILDRLGRKQLANFVNEDGLYDVILDSRKPEARKFRKWITSEVLPSIRKTGGYMVSKIDFSNPDTVLQLAQNWKDEQVKRIEAEAMIEEQKPKVVFAESVMGSSNLILIRDFAKSLCDDNFKIGQNRLYAWFRENGILNSRNEPYQNYVERGYFEVITRVIGSGEATFTTNTTKITGAGQVYFAKRIRDTYKQEQTA